MALRQTATRDPVAWPGDISGESAPFLTDCDLISQEMPNGCGDKDWCHVAVIMLMQEYIQCPQESIRPYGNCLKGNWRQGGWNLQKNEDDLYDIAYAGLCDYLKSELGLMAHACCSDDTTDELSHNGVPSDLPHVEIQKPQRYKHQHQHQQQYTQPAALPCKCGNQNPTTSISEPRRPNRR